MVTTRTIHTDDEGSQREYCYVLLLALVDQRSRIDLLDWHGNSKEIRYGFQELDEILSGRQVTLDPLHDFPIACTVNNHFCGIYKMVRISGTSFCAYHIPMRGKGL